MARVPAPNIKLPTRNRNASYKHTPTCILPRLADGSRALTVTRAVADSLADDVIAKNAFSWRQPTRPHRLLDSLTSGAPGDSIRTSSPPPRAFERRLGRPRTPPASTVASSLGEEFVVVHDRPLSSPARFRRDGSDS